MLWKALASEVNISRTGCELFTRMNFANLCTNLRNPLAKKKKSIHKYKFSYSAPSDLKMNQLNSSSMLLSRWC